MKKTFRRALACLLAVLMVAFSMPFTALAATAHREWWIDDGLTEVTEEVPFNSQNSDDYGMGYELGQSISLTDDAEDTRDEHKPVIGVIVTSLGENGMPAGKPGLQDYYNTYYGFSTRFDYAAVADKVLNPGQLKAGQRIAVTVEMGGVDSLYEAQVSGLYDTSVLKSAYYSKSPTTKNGDAWAETGAGGTTAAKLYGGLFSAGVSMDPTYKPEQNQGTFMCSILCEYAASGEFDETASTYIGGPDEREFGKYGLTICTFFFEVMQDCDLKDVFKFNTHRAGTLIAPYAVNTTDDGLERVTFSKDDNITYAQWAPVIWDSYEAGETPDVPHVHEYETTSTTPATCTTDAVEHQTCKNTDGKCDALTNDVVQEGSALGHKFEGKVTPNAAEKMHNVQCIRCDETTLAACTYTAESAGATCTEGGSIVYTCACGDSDTRPDGDPLGHNMQVVKEEITTPATCTTDGVKTISYKCSRCDATDTKTEPVAALGHDLTSNTVTNAATCENDGSVVTTTTCSRCDYEDVKTEVLTKLGHDLTTEVDKTPATCTEDGKIVTTKTCSRCDYEDVQTEVLTKLGHDLSTETKTVPATYDADGQIITTTSCSRCDYHEDEVQLIPMLIGVQVTVTASGLGTATVKGLDVEDEDVTANCEPNSDVVLTATAGDGAKFAGWTVDGKVVSKDATITVKALADVTYVPVFQEIGSTFTIIFSDRYGNVFATQEVTSGAEIDLDAVKAPTVAGYTFVGWTVTAEEAANITEATIIRAVYEKDEAATFTVTADGCTITAGDVTATDKLDDVAYDTLVTVTADGAQAWKLDSADGPTVAYGPSYTFYVGSNVTVVPVKNAVTATPTVAAVSVTKVTDGAKVKASFLATRSMTDDCTYVSAGFVYGKNLDNDNITLDDVKAGSAVKAYYCSTNSEQFALTYSLAAQQGKMTARAFLAYEKNGEVTVIYAEPQTADYADLLK